VTLDGAAGPGVDHLRLPCAPVFTPA
jgi:hypothetical protein